VDEKETSPRLAYARLKAEMGKIKSRLAAVEESNRELDARISAWISTRSIVGRVLHSPKPVSLLAKTAMPTDDMIIGEGNACGQDNL
jgi:hypothetical protein